jgi:cytochrome subunit of sulfide dehydrogenase
MSGKAVVVAAAVSILAGTLPSLAQDHAPPLIAQACAGCHGQAGDGSGAVPAIAGKDRAEFLRTWEAFRAGTRPATVMTRIAPGYTDEEVAALADYFSALEARQ